MKFYANTYFIPAWNDVQSSAHKIAISKGWWDDERRPGEIIALMHSELSEALEAMRHDNPPSDHIPDFTGIEEELADVVIRIMDYAAHDNLRIAEAVVAKMQFNQDRPVKHGGKRF